MFTFPLLPTQPENVCCDVVQGLWRSVVWCSCSAYLPPSTVSFRGFLLMSSRDMECDVDSGNRKTLHRQFGSNSSMFIIWLYPARWDTTLLALAMCTTGNFIHHCFYKGNSILVYIRFISLSNAFCIFIYILTPLACILLKSVLWLACFLRLLCSSLLSSHTGDKRSVCFLSNRL